MIATSTYASGGNYARSVTAPDTTLCSDATCGLKCSCTCCVIIIDVEPEEEEEVTETVKARPIHHELRVSLQGGISGRHFTSHRKGSTAKKIKMWSGLNS